MEKVRINGDGSIRIIYDGITCHANGTSTSESIAVTNQAYNSNFYRSEYVGYTYTEGSQRGIATASNLKTQNETWYNSNLVSYADKIASGKFCNDRNMASGYSWSSQPISTFYYVGYDRSGAKSISSINPTLSCSDANDVYTLKIGAVTMDEVIMAGAKWGIGNSRYYLYNGQNYWTISPYDLWSNGTNRYASMLAVYADGKLYDLDIEGKHDLRPVINLHSDITFSGGDGTLNNPYIVAD